MKFVFIFVTLLILSQPSFADTHNEWLDCETVEDCVLTLDECKMPTAVNKTHLAEADKDFKKQAAQIDCYTSGSEDMKDYRMSCDYETVLCPKKNWLGMEVGVDPTAMCKGTVKKCTTHALK